MNVKWNQAFEAMKTKAAELEVVGVMAIAKKEADGKIRMELQTFEKEFDDWGNFYSIACSKIMEMVRTGIPSGTKKPLAGEFENFEGGTLSGDYYVTFSGAEGHIDLEIAKIGLETLLSEE